MMGHVKELTLRVRANEKVVASVSLLGVIACTFVGAGYFAPKADAALNPNEWIQEMREWKSKQTRSPVEDMLDNAHWEYDIDWDYDVMEDDCEEHTEEEEKEG